MAKALIVYEQGTSKVPVTLESHNLMHGNELRRVESFRRVGGRRGVYGSRSRYPSERCGRQQGAWPLGETHAAWQRRLAARHVISSHASVRVSAASSSREKSSCGDRLLRV